LLAAGPKGEIPSSNGFRKNVTVEAIRAHQAALQAIADANGGTRYSVSAGYAASAAYVQQAMIAAGYQVGVQTFQVNFAGDRTPPVLTQISPSPRNYVHRVEFQTMSQSGSGDVTAPVTTVDFTANPPADNTTNSGCEAGDFAGFTPGHIALVQRGTCQFSLKVANALAAGAAAVIIMNEGSPARRGLISGTLGAPQPIPVVEATYDIGAQLVSTPGLIMRVKVDYLSGAFDSYNVIAESPLGNANDVVVVGAPLDSDTQGPGINTASGSAALMEIARVFADERKPRNRMRFIWFGGFLQGMVGSQAYVASLAPADVARIRSMVLLPQIASPNFVRFVFDGDNSTFPADALVIAGPPGSGEIERLFTDYFGGSGIASAPIGLNGAADYRAFAQAGIPVGGIFSGSFGIKTAQEQSVFGGVAGIAYDPCFNLACDTYANVSTQALDEMSDAAAHVTLLLSRKNFAKSP
jgi:Zn-dependent M28 family amino/carboxypeptidase